MTETTERCGLVAIVGRANVGKSTLLNAILGQKLSITSRKPQTTRYRILGVHTAGETQLVFVDTPGWQRAPRNQMNRLMNRQVRQALGDVDLAVMLCDARGWQADDELVATMLTEAAVPSALVLNKHDLVRDKRRLLPVIDDIARSHPVFREYFPLCARSGQGVDALLAWLGTQLPAREHMFPPDQLTDRSERFLSAEIIREKTMRYLGDELPYRTSVIIEEFVDEDRLTRITATVWVDRDSQKSIVIGKSGALMKKIASDARRDLETLLGRKVFLTCWVKTKRGWADSAEALHSIGLDD
ncbi:MAG: GTPase Era [Gammaproteobacteria bacterium]